MYTHIYSIPGGTVGKESANAGDTRDVGSTLRSGRSPGEGSGNPPQYLCLENTTDRGVTIHAVTESDTTDMHTHIHSSAFSQYLKHGGNPSDQKW